MAAPHTNTFPASTDGLDAVVAEAVREDGFAIVRDVLDRARCEELIAEVGRVEREHGIEMPAGSMLVLHGSTWHGRGANRTADAERYGLSIQFVAGWCRQQQNLMLGTERETAAAYPRRLQKLIGYSLYLNVMGHVDREHPLTLLGVDEPPDMVWEKMDKNR